jgi:hypothetical protein
MTEKQDVINTYYIERTITGKDVLMLANSMKPFVFRGQPCFKWGLETTFERACNKICKLGWKDLEDKIRLEFERQACHHITRLPECAFEWLALMQHYGSPTRLLDFTRSIWAALFFAVDGATDDSALWAIDISWFKSNHDTTNPRKAIVSDYNKELALEIEKILTEDNDPESDEEWSAFYSNIEDNEAEGFDLGVIFAEPFFQNQRLAIQQGLFAFPQELFRSFEMNISKPLGSKSFEELSRKEGDTVIYKFKIPHDMHLSIVAFLSQMNITAATLFPGLEGFARSQINHVRLAEHYNEKLMKLIKGIPHNEDLVKAVFDGHLQG